MKPNDLRALRERVGLSQAALASQLGVSEFTVNRWENGAARIRPLVRWAVLGLVAALAVEGGPDPPGRTGGKAG